MLEGLFISLTCNGTPVMSWGKGETPRMEFLETQVLLPDLPLAIRPKDKMINFSRPQINSW